MKQINFIDVHVTAPHYLQSDVSVFRAGDYEMSVSRLQDWPEFCALFIYYLRICLIEKEPYADGTEVKSEERFYSAILYFKVFVFYTLHTYWKDAIFFIKVA